MAQTELENLDPQLRERLRALEQEIRLESITTSFSIEDRDASGRKKSTFYSVRAVRGQVDDTPNAGNWDLDEAKVIGCLLSKHVVLATYRDAAKKGILSEETAAREAYAICSSYDANLAKLVKS